MKSEKPLTEWGIRFFYPLFIFIIILSTACENNETGIFKQLSSGEVKKCNLTIIHNTISDSIILNFPDAHNTVNANVPFKLKSEKLYVLTMENNIIVYPLKFSDINSNPINPIQIIELPKNIEGISDFYFINNHGNILVSTLSNLVLNFNYNDKKVDTILDGGKYVYNSMPYIGMTPIKLNNKFILPYTKINDFVEGNFLSVYDQNFKYLHGIGNSGYVDQDCKLPYYDTPIISNFTDSNMFYASFSSSNKILKCDFTKDLKIVYNTIYETEEETSTPQDCISKNQLYDYKFLNKLYVTSSYWLSLVAKDKILYRIKKKSQPFINVKTRKKNTMLDAPWSMDIIDTDAERTRRLEFPAREFLYLSGFLFNNSYYIPKSPSNNKIIIYGFI